VFFKKRSMGNGKFPFVVNFPAVPFFFFPGYEGCFSEDITGYTAQFAPQIAAEFCDNQVLFESESRFGIAKLHAFMHRRHRARKRYRRPFCPYLFRGLKPSLADDTAPVNDTGGHLYLVRGGGDPLSGP
jgi:hypothetical protein